MTETISAIRDTGSVEIVGIASVQRFSVETGRRFTGMLGRAGRGWRNC